MKKRTPVQIVRLSKELDTHQKLLQCQQARGKDELGRRIPFYALIDAALETYLDKLTAPPPKE